MTGTKLGNLFTLKRVCMFVCQTPLCFYQRTDSRFHELFYICDNRILKINYIIIGYRLPRFRKLLTPHDDQL